MATDFMERNRKGHLFALLFYFLLAFGLALPVRFCFFACFLQNEQHIAAPLASFCTRQLEVQASENGNWHPPTATIATVATVGTAGTAGTATAMLAATQMPPQERTTLPVSNPASISLQTPQPDGGKAVTEQTEQTEQKEKTENKNTQNAETTSEATKATENTKDVELNGSAKAPNKKTPIRQTSFEERLDAFVGNLDLSEALFACLCHVMYESQWITMNHNESQWITMNHNESQWITMNHNESQWITYQLRIPHFVKTLHWSAFR